MPQLTVTETLEGNSDVGAKLGANLFQFSCSHTSVVIVQESPEEVRRPDNSQVFSVHVSDGAEGGQVGEVSHEDLQSPVDKERQIFNIDFTC